VISVQISFTFMNDALVMRMLLILRFSDRSSMLKARNGKEG